MNLQQYLCVVGLVPLPLKQSSRYVNTIERHVVHRKIGMANGERGRENVALEEKNLKRKLEHYGCQVLTRKREGRGMVSMDRH